MMDDQTAQSTGWPLRLPLRVLSDAINHHPNRARILKQIHIFAALSRQHRIRRIVSIKKGFVAPKY
jgi:hypothetical protein